MDSARVAARHVARIVSLLSLVFLAAACSHEAARAPGPEAPTFVVVRHAEKDTATTDPDPALIVAGEQRAQRLARSLEAASLVAVYATPYRRTRQTAAPTALAHDLPVTAYDAREPADAFAATLRERHRAGTILVVGHSNTVPGIVAALCGCDIPAMTEAEYDHRFVVEFDADGQARVSDRPLPP